MYKLIRWLIQFIQEMSGSQFNEFYDDDSFVPETNKSIDVIDDAMVQNALQLMGATVATGVTLKSLQSRLAKPKTAEDKLLAKVAGILKNRTTSLRGNRQEKKRQSSIKQRLRQVKTRRQIEKLDPEEFEYWTADYLEQWGFKNAIVSAYGNDFGVDVHVTCPNRKQAVVQCKKYSKPIGRPVVQQIYGVMILLGAKRCYVVTNATFSRPAWELAEQHKEIILLDGAFLISGQKPPC